MNKHFAILVDVPAKGNMMMFLGYYEENKEQIDEKYEEVSMELPSSPILDKLKSHKYKLFKQKEVSNDQD
jgi:hypothetical protein